MTHDVSPEPQGSARTLSRRRFLSVLGIGAGAAAVGATGVATVLTDSGGSKAVTTAATTPLELGAKTYSYADFTLSASGMTAAILAGGIIGQGSERTIIDLTGPIRTQFPSWELGDTTQYNVIRVEAPIGQRLQKPVLSGFTLQITAPRNAAALFNGIRIARCDDLVIEDVRVIGVAGSGNQPPFETFGLDLLACSRPVIRNVVIDGHSLGGAGIGLNSTNDALLESCRSGHNANSHGFACYQSDRITFVNCVSNDNGTGAGGSAGAGFNHEDCEDAVHVQSQADRNSLASFRFLATGASTHGHRLIHSTGDGSIMTEGNQSPNGISVEASIIDGGWTRG